MHEDLIDVNEEVGERNILWVFAVPPTFPQGEVAAKLSHGHVCIDGGVSEEGRDLLHIVFTLAGVERLIVEVAIARWRPLCAPTDFPQFDNFLGDIILFLRLF